MDDDSPGDHDAEERTADYDFTPPCSASLADCFSFDPIFDESMNRLFDEDEERRRQKSVYNNVLKIELSVERCNNIDWCDCRNDAGDKCCSVQGRPRSCYCCKEAHLFSSECAKKLKAKADGFSCITRHPDFANLAVNKTVVNTCAKLLAESGRSIVFKEQYNNRELRYAAYRNVTLWIYGRLGRGIRLILPSCVVCAIQTAFPKAYNEQYVGFRASRSEDDDDDS